LYTMGVVFSELFSAVPESVNNVFQQRLDDRKQRVKVAEALMAWLTIKACKKPIPDLEAKLQEMKARVDKLVEGMAIEIEDDKPVVKATGSDEDTWKLFRLGSSWFEPNPDLMETVLSGLFSE
jgi:hypothetical protein